MGLVQKLKSFGTAENVKSEDELDKEASNEPSVIEETVTPTSPSVRMERTITRSEVDKAKEELHVLAVERDAIKSAIEQIKAENNKKTKDNVNELEEKYKTYLNQIERNINDRKRLLNLYELEKAQTDIIQLFNAQLEEINKKIESVRASLDLPLQKQTSIFYYYKS
jgi:hypothetical protein